MFRFLPAEIAEMEATALNLTSTLFPTAEAIDALAAKFNASPERAAGKVTITPKQVLTWFHNHRYAPRTKENKARRAAELGKTVLPASKLHRASSSNVQPSVQASSSLGNRRMDSGQFLGEITPPWTHVPRLSTPFQPAECVDLHGYDDVLCLQEIVPLSKLHRPPPAKSDQVPNIYQASRLETSVGCLVQPTKSIVDVQPMAIADLTSNENNTRAEKEEPTKAIGDLTPNENITRVEREEATKAIVDLTFNENSTRAEKKEEATKAIVDLTSNENNTRAEKTEEPTKAIVDLTSNENSTRIEKKEELAKAMVDLTSNENSTRAEKKETTQFKLMGVNIYVATMASNLELEKPACR